ncbi:MAG: hypothetical protein OSB14_02220, partial [Planctomycetota bacterium]|nr:hypothetical protein [Planctomycetota bacterium]
ESERALALAPESEKEKFQGKLDRLREMIADAHDTLAWALFFNGEYEEAVAESERALGLAPEGTKEQFQGQLDRLRGMIDEARAEEDG